MSDTSVMEAAVASAEGVTGALGPDRVAALSEGEPQWLVDRRRHAWEVYERTPLPTTHSEEWRYTDLSRKLSLDDLGPGEAAPLPDDRAEWPTLLRAALESDEAASGHLVLANGRVTHADVRPDLAEKGVILMSLRQAVAAHPELLEKHLATEAVPAEDGKFQALNAALWTDGVFLHVPPGVRLDDPVRVTRWFGEAGAAVFSRTLVVADPGSQVSYIDELISPDLDRQTLTSSVVEVLASDAATVQYVALQRLGENAFYLSQQRTLAGRDATLDTLNVSLGATTSRVDLNARLLGPGASSDMFGLYFGDDDQHFDHNTSQDHVAPNAQSDLLYKGALAGRSRSVFRGIIRVHEGAQRTDAYQTNRNLLLSRTARADSLPNLEIEADDVRCSHAATVGELEEEELFYLMTRGLTRDEAMRLAVMGFLGEVLSRLPLGGVSEKVTAAIERKLDA